MLQPRRSPPPTNPQLPVAKSPADVNEKPPDAGFLAFPPEVLPEAFPEVLPEALPEKPHDKNEFFLRSVSVNIACNISVEKSGKR